ncbi:family 16 glycosylhydrolase [Cognatishimia activa]|uniref:Beta-glucanase n=1 Tax=Cognatishimia activa TaxID=1715691 RepID=A0A0P1J3W1_9RHOB|nr:family 16 glycosylhydrolase [Cognatishimia activa]CUJ19272.1 Endo-1,3-1,4-beta-glycanase ExoK precursor [Cognatishimia activa]CUK27627.1 Endo-1,3-1,4-beta-glycanase ExoK precursor [Cognatishimia activa]
MFLRVLFYVLTFGFSSLAAIAQNKPSPDPFYEEFESFSERRWYVSDGWTNGSHQNCYWARQAVSDTAEDVVTLNYFAHGDGYLCSEIQTRAFFLYGTFEARMRVEPGSGRNGAFFAYAGRVHGQPHHEIDFEILTKSADEVWLNRFVNRNDFGEGGSVQSPNPTSEFHDYAFVWEPGRLRWYIDGVLVRENSDGVPYLPMKIYFSHWAGEKNPKWLGRFRRPEGAVGLEIDRFAYTPLGSPCHFPESIVCDLK